ncbi:hypothetical protein MMC25_004763 [Agyrium rufum]|nr:hypothetical protein [Agyrium rufum]
MGEPNIPSEHKACIYASPGKNAISIKQVPTPKPGPGQVLINLTHSGVCFSDMAVMTNGWKTLPAPCPEGQVGGHEGVGHVVAFGPGAEAAGLKIGDRVGVKWIAQICGSCAPCLDGMDGMCFAQKVSGYYTPGTFQQYVVSPADYVTAIPEGLDSAEAAPQLCAGVTVYSALRKAGAKSGQWVLVSGAGGGLGHLACQLGAKGFAYRIIGIDADPSKKDLVMQSGAEVFLNARDFETDEALVKEVQKYTGGIGVHAAVVCAANNRAYAQTLSCLRYGGTLVCVGIPDGQPVDIRGAWPGRIVAKGLSIVGTVTGNRRDAKEVLDFAARGVIKSHIKVVKMDELQDVFSQMEAGKITGRVVLDLQ